MKFKSLLFICYVTKYDAEGAKQNSKQQTLESSYFRK